MRLVEMRGLDGIIVETYMVCESCGFIGWGDKCPNEQLFSKCNPRQDPRHGRKKYRKTPASQVTLRGANLRELFWGKGRSSPGTRKSEDDQL